MFTNKRYEDAILNIQQLLAHQREYENSGHGIFCIFLSSVR